MTAAAAVELSGVPGSPYTRKMLALLRYRRIPYRLYPSRKFLLTDQADRIKSRPEPKIALLPTFYFQDETGAEIALCDSTPIIRKLELEHRGREVVPESALGFINYLIEDYADEWLTKAMFHYRWHYEADSLKAGQMLPRWNNTNADEAALQAKADSVRELQISRLSYVGSNAKTKTAIESSFKRLVGILDKLLTLQPFVLGQRPSSADFALYGQLTALALFDPTPQAIILKQAPRLYAWTETLEDLSGYEPLETDWLELEISSGNIKGLLTEIGRVYTPYLTANAAAANREDANFKCEIDGSLWSQGTFPYQAKCLQWIRDEFAALDNDNQTQVMSLAQECGFSDLIKDPESL